MCAGWMVLIVMDCKVIEVHKFFCSLLSTFADPI
jgi:hypothetical protein